MTTFNASITIAENEPYKINSMNVWDFKWENTGQRHSVVQNGRSINVPVYKISDNGTYALFVALEVSNNVWRIDHPYST
jgi:hypothetical protein